MDTMWEDVIPEGSNLDPVITRGDHRFEVLAIWIGPVLSETLTKVPVIKVAGLPDFCKVPYYPEDGTLPYRRFRGTIQLEEEVDQPDEGLWGALEVKRRKRAKQQRLAFIPRCYNSEPSQGPCYTLYNVPGLDVDGLRELINDVGNEQLEVL